MKLKFERSMRLVSHLLAYCHTLGATKYHVDITPDTKATYISIQADIAEIEPAVLHRLEETLKIPRQHEVEENYWNLSGESEWEDDLTLVAVMIDESTLRYENGVLTLDIVRLEQ